jgi:hypothetical protein
MVYPSGFDRATKPEAMVVEAPALLSTTIVVPRISAILVETVRAAISAAPPGTKPTTNVIGRCGQDSCATENCEENKKIAVHKARLKNFIVMSF